MKISVFIFKLDTFGLKKTLNRLELKWVKVRNVESRSTTSLRQLSEQVTEAQNPGAKNRLAFHVFCVSTCLNPQNYNSCHFLDCQVTWAFLSVGKIMVYKFNRFIMNKKEIKGQVVFFFLSASCSCNVLAAVIHETFLRWLLYRALKKTRLNTWKKLLEKKWDQWLQKCLIPMVLEMAVLSVTVTGLMRVWCSLFLFV